MDEECMFWPNGAWEGGMGAMICVSLRAGYLTALGLLGPDRS